jgi:hypothetical protein
MKTIELIAGGFIVNSDNELLVISGEFTRRGIERYSLLSL